METIVCGSLKGQISAEALETWGEELRVALKQLADSSLADFGPLHETAKSLPEEFRAEWHSVVEAARLPPPLTSATRRDKTATCRFIETLRVLNERWLVKLGCLLYRHSPLTTEPRGAPSIWEDVGIEPVRIEQRFTHAFHDRRVTVYSVMPLRKVASIPRQWVSHQGCYDGIQDCVVLHRLCILVQHVQAWHLCGGEPENPLQREILSQCSFTARMREEYLYFTETIFPQFCTGRSLSMALMVRTLIEELRHAVDHGRALARFPREYDSADYYRLFAENVLSPRGRLRQLWNTLNDEDRAVFGRSVSEISAQMTAAAVGPDPRMLVWEWWVGLQNTGLIDTHERLVRESLADVSGCAIRLLAEVLHLIRRPSGWLSWLRDDPFDLAVELDTTKLLQFAEELGRLSPEKLRITLRQVYQREFQLGTIDEAPFRQIAPDGTLTNLDPNWREDSGCLVAVETIWP